MRLKNFIFIIFLLFFAKNAFSQDSQISVDTMFANFIEIGYGYYFNPFFSLKLNFAEDLVQSNSCLLKLGVTKFSNEYSGFFCGIDFGIMKWTEKSAEFGWYLLNVYTGYRIKLFKRFFIGSGIKYSMTTQSLVKKNDISQIIPGEAIFFMLEIGYLF